MIISFDNLAEAGGRHLAREPWAGKYVYDKGWSHLGVLANGATWFRDPDLIARLEALRDEGFFARSKRVVLCGSSMGGFGALVFSRLVDDPIVIALNPQSTLDIKQVPWENRYAKGKRQNWRLPYSDVAGHLGHIARGYIILDRFEKLNLRYS